MEDEGSARVVPEKTESTLEPLHRVEMIPGCDTSRDIYKEHYQPETTIAPLKECISLI